MWASAREALKASRPVSLLFDIYRLPGLLELTIVQSYAEVFLTLVMSAPKRTTQRYTA